MEVQCKTFVRDSPAMPDMNVLLGVQDPAQLEQLYKEAGLTRVASNIGPLKKAQAAASCYDTLSAENYELYESFLPDRKQLDECVIPPPSDAVAVLVAARNSNAFDGFEVLSHPETHESLLLGTVNTAGGIEHFKLAQWTLGTKLTTEADLKKLLGFRHTLDSEVKKFKSNLRPKPAKKKQPLRTRNAFAYYGIMTAVMGGLAWSVFLITGSWWLFLGALLVVLISCSIITYRGTGTYAHKKARYLVAWIFVIHMALAIAAGGVHLNTWNTEPRTYDVVVCDIGQQQTTKDWYLVTNKGKMTLDPGFYNGTYYPAQSKEAAQMFVGKWIHATGHGHLSNYDPTPYLSEATTVRDGSCGNK